MTLAGMVPHARLERYLLLACPLQIAGLLIVTSVFLFIDSDPWILGLLVGVAIMFAVTLWGVRKVRSGQVERALIGQLVGLWLLALIDTAIVPYVLPCFVAVIVLGAIVALPYLSRATLRLVLIATSVVALGVGLLGELQNWTDLTAQLPTWVPETVVIVMLPAPVAHAVLLLWNYRINLIEALSEAQHTAVELVASRERVVASTDAERRRIERDLHDGAQQTLMAMLMRSQSDAYTKDDLTHDVRHVIHELRDLAHGIYPPLLAQRGLSAALNMAAERAALATTVDCDTRRRYGDVVESTVYFCVLEALQNAAKHAGIDARARVTVRDDGDRLRFEIADDGVGFDRATMVPGAGLTNMADRIGAVGGVLRTQSSPSAGTTVLATLPV